EVRPVREGAARHSLAALTAPISRGGSKGWRRGIRPQSGKYVARPFLTAAPSLGVKIAAIHVVVTCPDFIRITFVVHPGLVPAAVRATSSTCIDPVLRA
ncbi:unnamed protein product, partial [Ectocarpus sp. 12 AP-2014]